MIHLNWVLAYAHPADSLGRAFSTVLIPKCPAWACCLISELHFCITVYIVWVLHMEFGALYF